MSKLFRVARIASVCGGYLVAAWAAHAADCPSADSLSHGLQTFQSGEVSYTVAIPESCRTRSCGSILDIHGALMSVDDQEQGLHMRARAAIEGASASTGAMIVVQPQAPGKPPLWSPSLSEPVFKAFACINDAFHTDAHRRYVDGFSQGAYMAAAFYCRHPAYFSAYALVAGGSEQVADCLDQKRPPLLYIHGRSDQLVDFSFATDLRTLLERRTKPYQVTPDIVDYTAENFEIETYFHDGQNGLSGGHCLIGGDGRLGCTGKPAAGEMIMAFFRRSQKISAGE